MTLGKDPFSTYQWKEFPQDLSRKSKISQTKLCVGVLSLLSDPRSSSLELQSQLQLYMYTIYNTDVFQTILVENQYMTSMRPEDLLYSTSYIK